MLACIACGETKPEDSFSRMKGARGRQYRCKPCHAAHYREYRKEHRDEERARHRAAYAKDPKRYIAKQQRRYAKDPERFRQAARDRYHADPEIRLEASRTAARRRNEYAGFSLVYFVDCGQGTPVKIGWTKKNPFLRLSEMQHSNPAELRLVGVLHAEHRMEVELHDQFAAANIRGEWFHPTESLVGYIARNAIPASTLVMV